MTCVTTVEGTICSPPYDAMKPAGLTEDLMCGTSTLLLWALGIGIGWLAAEKAVSYLR